jgi:hypothetical protein
MTRIHDIHPGEENEVSQSGRLLLFLGFTIAAITIIAAPLKFLFQLFVIIAV